MLLFCVCLVFMIVWFVDFLICNFFCFFMDLKVFFFFLNDFVFFLFVESWDNVGLLVELSLLYIVNIFFLINDLIEEVMEEVL